MISEIYCNEYHFSLVLHTIDVFNADVLRWHVIDGANGQNVGLLCVTASGSEFYPYMDQHLWFKGVGRLGALENWMTSRPEQSDRSYFDQFQKNP